MYRREALSALGGAIALDCVEVMEQRQRASEVGCPVEVAEEEPEE